MKKIEHNRVIRRKKRVSMNVRGNETKPRISVNRSNRFIYAQAIDDVNRKTLASYSSFSIKKSDKSIKLKKVDEAKQVGIGLAKVLLDKKIKQVVYDRGSYMYKGRVKSLAEGLREGGIQV
ncbi:MAG: 50S ribosomal protein L18 [bacterium]|nr:50S ribosomal protein L18 [bacterium]